MTKTQPWGLALNVSIDRIPVTVHHRLRAQPLLYRLLLGSRILLAVGFVPTGMVKLLNRPFGSMDPAMPAGAFFQILQEGGLYWQFLGLGQVAAGLCLLVPATALLGAVMFLPIMLNVVVITVAYDFGTTTWVTVSMLMANVYLLAWDYDRLRTLVGQTVPEDLANCRSPQHRLGAVERLVYFAGTISGLLLFSAARSLLPWELNDLGFVYVYLLAALVSLVLAAWLGLFRPRSLSTAARGLG